MPGQEHDTPGQSSRLAHDTPDVHAPVGPPAPPSPGALLTTSSSPHPAANTTSNSIALELRMTFDHSPKSEPPVNSSARPRTADRRRRSRSSNLEAACT